MRSPQLSDKNSRLKQIDRLFHGKTAAAYDKNVDIKFNLYHALFLYPFIEKIREK